MQAELSAGQTIVITVDGYGSNCGPFQLNIKGPRISSQPYAGRYWSFNTYAYTLLFMRHMNDLGYVSPISSSIDKLDATFKIVNGLADPQCLSFEARSHPGRFLRHFGYRLVLNSPDGSILFRQDATFCMKRGLADLSYLSFESYNYPGRYIRHRGNELWVEPGGGDPYAADATFKLVSPWSP
ncbi:arabinofuranosidase [Corallococcus terminator]|uniref:Arabinofuranosidase n=1 Tax=Corallococcus terminator TaxID=2316733 RepID=A0A3A8I386_9BACT|nr:arabinofuranosidase [Corallococcus terminator]